MVTNKKQQPKAAPTAPTTEITAQGREKAVEFQAFGSNERVSLSIAIVRKWLARPTRSGQIATDGDIMRFIMLCKARQLNPWEGDAFLVGYDAQGGPEFNLITAHQAFLKRAEIHDDYDGMESGVIVQDGPDGEIKELEGDFVPPGQVLLGAWTKVYRKDQSHPKIARLNLANFDKGRAQWNTNKAGMIVKCAEADALRGAFPNTLGGMYNDAEMALTNAGAAGIFEPEEAPAPEKISEEQRTALVNVAKEVGAVEKLGKIVNDAGFEMIADITVDRYADIEVAVRAAGPARADAPQTVDGELVDEEEATAPEEEISPLEQLRMNVQSQFEEFPESQRKDLQAGKKFIKDMNEEELADFTKFLREAKDAVS